jgi:hypothetical protein
VTVTASSISTQAHAKTTLGSTLWQTSITGIREVGENVTQRIVNEVSARVQSAEDAEVQKLQGQLADEDVRNRIAASLASDLEARLRGDLASNRRLRDEYDTKHFFEDRIPVFLYGAVERWIHLQRWRIRSV